MLPLTKIFRVGIEKFLKLAHFEVESFQPNCLLKVEVLVKAGATGEGHPRVGNRTTELVSG